MASIFLYITYVPMLRYTVKPLYNEPFIKRNLPNEMKFPNGKYQ